MKEIRKNKWSLSLNQFMVAMLCFLAFGLTGCQDSDKKLLEKTVEGVNEKCPIVVNPEIQIAKLELEEDYLTYYFDYSEQSYMLPDEIDASLKKELANQILNAISRFSGEEKEILDLLLKKEMGLKFVMDFKRSKKQITVKFTAKEIRSKLNSADNASDDSSADEESETSSSLATLKSSVETGKNLLPMDLGNGITMTDMYLSNGSLYYIYEVDENQVPLASWNDEVIANVKAAIINELKTSAQGDAANTQLIHLCSQTGTDIVYRYRGDQTGIEHDITVGSNELE